MSVTAGIVSQCGVIIEPALLCVLDVDQPYVQFYDQQERIVSTHQDPCKVAKAGWPRKNQVIIDFLRVSNVFVFIQVDIDQGLQ